MKSCFGIHSQYKTEECRINHTQQFNYLFRCKKKTMKKKIKLKNVLSASSSSNRQLFWTNYTVALASSLMFYLTLADCQVSLQTGPSWGIEEPESQQGVALGWAPHPLSPSLVSARSIWLIVNPTWITPMARGPSAGVTGGGGASATGDSAFRLSVEKESSVSSKPELAQESGARCQWINPVAETRQQSLVFWWSFHPYSHYSGLLFPTPPPPASCIYVRMGSAVSFHYWVKTKAQTCQNWSSIYLKK